MSNDDDDEACVDGFLFIEVEETKELDGLSSNGVLGLSPDVSEYNTATGSLKTNSFMDNLF